MFAALKKMFGRGEGQSTQTAVPPPPPIQAPRATAPAPAQPPVRITPRTGEIAPRTPAAPSPAPRGITPTPAPAAPPSRAVTPSAPSAAPAKKTGEAGDPGFVSIPMSIIAGRIPAEVSQIVLPMAVGEASIPLSVVLPQLSKGVVRIPLSVIRAGASAQAFRGPVPSSDAVIDLPLGEVVSRLDPSKLARRQPVKRWDAPPELGNLFCPKGEPLKPATSFFNEPAAAQSEAARPSPANATAASGDTAFLYALSRAALEEKPIAMNAMAAIPGPAKAVPASAAPPVAPAPVPMAPAASTPLDPTQSAAADELITVSLAQVCERWPESVRNEINKLRLASSQIAIPASEMEPVLKTGRVSFTWRQVVGWLRPQAAAVGPESAELRLDFPLAVVASLFLSRFKARDAKKVSVGADIPDVFGNAAGIPPKTQPVVAAEPVRAPLAPSAPAVEFAPRPRRRRFRSRWPRPRLSLRRHPSSPCNRRRLRSLLWRFQSRLRWPLPRFLGSAPFLVSLTRPAGSQRRLCSASVICPAWPER